MHEKLEDIGWADSAPWEETLVITQEDPNQVGWGMFQPMSEMYLGVSTFTGIGLFPKDRVAG
jgi:hypothetical protein